MGYYLKKYRIFIAVLAVITYGYFSLLTFRIDSEAVGCEALGEEGLKINLRASNTLYYLNWNNRGIKVEDKKNLSKHKGIPYSEFNASYEEFNKLNFSQLIFMESLNNRYLVEPFYKSANKKWLLVTEKHYPEGKNYWGKKIGFLVIDLVDGRIIQSYKIKNKIGEIAAITFNEKNSLIALVSKTWEIDMSFPFGRFAHSMGHPMGYSDIYVQIIDLEGNALCKTIIQRKISHASAAVSWE